MMKLLQIHVQENVIDKETAGAMAGALTYKSILVKEVMTATENAFMLNVDDKLSFETIAKIFKTGFSRIPVYEIQKVCCLSLFFFATFDCFYVFFKAHIICLCRSE